MKLFKEWLEKRLTEETGGGMDLYGARESLKNALAATHLGRGPITLWDTLGNVKEKVAGNQHAMSIVDQMSNLTQRWLQDIRNQTAMVQDRSGAARVPSGPERQFDGKYTQGEAGYDVFKKLYDQYSRQLYALLNSFNNA